MNSDSNVASVVVFPADVGYADWHDLDLLSNEEMNDSIEMAGLQYGMSDSMLSRSKPIRIQASRSCAKMNCSRSPTETFLSAASPFELPFVPTTRAVSHTASSTSHASDDDLQVLPQRPKCIRTRGQVSSLTCALAQQAPSDRLACRRQLRRKENLVLRDQEVPSMKRPAYLLNLEKQPESYNYTSVTSW